MLKMLLKLNQLYQIHFPQINGQNDFQKDLKRLILVILQGCLYDIEIYFIEIL